MNQTIIITIASLSGLGAIAAMILYVVARQFKVETDPRIDEIKAYVEKTLGVEVTHHSLTFYGHIKQ